MFCFYKSDLSPFNVLPVDASSISTSIYSKPSSSIAALEPIGSTGCSTFLSSGEAGADWVVVS